MEKLRVLLYFSWRLIILTITAYSLFLFILLERKKKKDGEKTWHMVSEKLAGLLGGDGPMCNRKHFKIIDWKMI